MAGVGIRTLIRGGMLHMLYTMDLMQSCRLAAICLRKNRKQVNIIQVLTRPPADVCLFTRVYDRPAAHSWKKSAAWLQRLIGFLTTFHFKQNLLTFETLFKQYGM